MIASLQAIALAAALVAAEPGTGPDPASGLSADWLYNPVTRPTTVEVVAPGGAARVELVLLDVDGGVLLRAPQVVPGRVDLMEVLPGLHRLRRAAWLQLIADGTPQGSSLVVQPLLSRLVPEAVEDVNPNGIRYTRIAGWHDETTPPEPPPVPEPGAAPPIEPPEAPDDTVPDPALSEDWLAPPDAAEARLFTGLRIYPDRDVVLRTSHGELRLALRPDVAPNTAWNFRALCAGGFYRGVVFHRVVPFARTGDPFVIQAGDPSGGGSGGPGYWLPIERSLLPHDVGVISMARDVDPDSAGSQFFLCLSRAGTARLDGNYCAFGETIEGAGTIEAIAAVELADVATGRPKAPPVILGADLVAAPPRARRARTEHGNAEPVPEPDPVPERVPR